jgi:transposase-like protein
VWTFCAIDADTKLVPAYKVGKRDTVTANAFMSDLSSRLKNRVQLSSDGLAAYIEAVEQSFGADVDYGQIVKPMLPLNPYHRNVGTARPNSLALTRRLLPAIRFRRLSQQAMSSV